MVECHIWPIFSHILFWWRPNLGGGGWRSTVRGWIGNRPNNFCPKWIWPLSMFFGVDAVMQYKALITRQIIIGARFPQTRADPHMIFSLPVLSSSTKLLFFFYGKHVFSLWSLSLYFLIPALPSPNVFFNSNLIIFFFHLRLTYFTGAELKKTNYFETWMSHNQDIIFSYSNLPFRER